MLSHYICFVFLRNDELIDLNQIQEWNEKKKSHYIINEFLISVRKCTDKPQLISTSRHITQGAAEIKDMQTEGNTISITADLVAHDTYTVTFYVPDGYKLDTYEGFESHTESDNLVRLTFIPEETKEYKFSVSFKK